MNEYRINVRFVFSRWEEHNNIDLVYENYKDRNGKPVLTL